MPYFIDPNSASNLPSAIQSSPEYQVWLKKTFPLPSSHGINMNASTNNNNNNTSRGFISNTPSSTALMIISSDNKNSSSSDASSSSSSNLKNFDMKSLQQQNSNVIINNSAIDANEKFKNAQNSSNDNGASSTSARSVTLEDFNTAFYRKKEGLLRMQREKKEKEDKQQQQQEKEKQQEQLPEMKTLPQRRTDREADEIEPQQQNQNSVSSSSAVFALPDHLGRSFLHCPQQISASEIKRDHFTAQKLPQKLSHSYKTTSSPNASTSSLTNNSAPAITTLTWVPPHGHLAMIGDVTGTCSIFEIMNTNNTTNANNSVRTEKLAVYSGFHRNAIRDISFPAGDARHSASSASGTLQGASSDRFLTCSTDAANPLALWDTERAQIISEYRLSESWTTYSKFIREAGCAAVAFAPPGIHAAATRGDSLFASAFGKTIVVWDARSSTRVIDLEAHHAAVTHLKFVQYGRGLFSCGDDKTLRLWDLRSAAAVQEFSHSQMHSISGIVEHPWTGEVLAQSNDDKVRCLMRTGSPAASNPELFVGRLLPQAGQYVFGKEEKEFSGHNVAGTSCRLGLSRTDGGSVVSSGDVFGNFFMWQYDGGKQQQKNNDNNNNNADSSGSTKLLRKFKASAKELTVHDWHPIVSGMLLTGGRDGLLKCWK